MNRVKHRNSIIIILLYIWCLPEIFIVLIFEYKYMYIESFLSVFSVR